MKRKSIILLAFLPLFGVDLQFQGVSVAHQSNGETKNVIVKKERPFECFDVRANVAHVFGGEYAPNSVPKSCKKDFTVTVGKIQPFVIEKGVETIGELEMLQFMEQMGKEGDSYLLVDARGAEWYELMTIPGAVNIPHTELEYDEEFLEDYYEAYKKMGVDLKEGILDFSRAKNLAVFCNGSWCVQSSRYIQSILKAGYPKEKIRWYRGGLQDWLALNMTVIKK